MSLRAAEIRNDLLTQKPSTPLSEGERNVIGNKHRFKIDLIKKKRAIKLTRGNIVFLRALKEEGILESCPFNLSANWIRKKRQKKLTAQNYINHIERLSLVISGP